MKMIFGSGQGAPGPLSVPPTNEYMGSDVQLISANKNCEGQKAGGLPSKSGDDAWLGGMPGMKSFAPIFKA